MKQSNISKLLAVSIVAFFVTIPNIAQGASDPVVPLSPAGTVRLVPSQYSTIQAAIDAAQGGSVFVADGTYTGPGNRDIDFKGNVVSVYSENGPKNCIINCQGTVLENHRGFYFQSGEGQYSSLQGFTIINGYMSGDGLLGMGGAICCHHSSPLIYDCIIKNNYATRTGGGISSIEASPIVWNCLITGNYKGGIASTGGSPWIYNCTVTGNTVDAGGAGAGLYVSYDSLPIIANSIFWGDSPGEIFEESGSANVFYSDIQGGWPGNGNIANNPRFVSGPLGDYYLSQTAAGQGITSPCVDTGSDSASARGMDIYTTRTDSVCDFGTVDMGYHYPVAVVPSCSVTTPTTPNGPSSGQTGQILSFSTDGSTCSNGHSVEYRFDWGDGNYSSWGSAIQPKSYDSADTYTIKAQARCTSSHAESGWSGGKQVTITPPSCSVTTPTTPNGPSSGQTGQILSFSTDGSTCSNGHSVEYRFDWGDGNYSSWGSAIQPKSYDSAGTYTIKAQARCTSSHAESGWSGGKQVTITPPPCSVPPPNTPSGPSSGQTGQTLSFSTGGSGCSNGHSVEYRFDWGDGNYSSWGSATQPKSYDSAGTYTIKAQARCTSSHAESGWSGGKQVTITPPGVTIRGTVYDAVTGGFITSATITTTGAGRTETNSNGQYEITGLSPGQLIVNASKIDYGDSLHTISDAKSGQVYTHTFYLVPDVICGFTPRRNGFNFKNPGAIVAHCRGMTYTALYNYLNEIYPPSEDELELNQLWTNLVINVHWRQTLDSLVVISSQYSPEENIDFIKRCLLADTPCPITLIPPLFPPLYHSVLAYKLVEARRDNGAIYVIYVYDSNVQYDSTNHDTVSAITLVRENDRWSFTYQNYTGCIADFLAIGFCGDIPIGYCDIHGKTYAYVDALIPGLKYKVKSPATIEVTDPTGFSINKDSVDLNGKYYRILNGADNGHDEDSVIILDPIGGKYLVEVIPDPCAGPNETYSLEEYKFGEKSVLAEDVEIQDIPDEAYESIVVFPTIPCDQAVALLDYELLEQERISRTEFEYTFRLRAANWWEYDVKDITAQLVGEPNNTVVLDDTVGFSFIPAGAEALSDDTFKIRTDRTIEVSPSEVVWKICDCKMQRRSDFGHDWSVDFRDFSAWAEAWLRVGDNMPEDVYPDGKIDLMDLMIFSEEWLR